METVVKGDGGVTGVWGQGEGKACYVL